MKFDEMEKAIAFMLDTTPGGEVFYRNDYYSCVVSNKCRMHATFDWKQKSISVTGETWDNCRDFGEPYQPFSKKELCSLAFDKLRSERKYDPALRLASAMITGNMIELGLSDTDWEIHSALKYCGCEPTTVSHFKAVQSFNGTVKLPDQLHRRIKAEFYD